MSVCFIPTQHALWTPKYPHNLCASLHPICCRCTRLCHFRTGCALQISAVMWLTSPLGETGQRAQTVHFILSDCTGEDIQKPPSIRHEAKMAMLNRFAFGITDGKKRAGCAVFRDELAKKKRRDFFSGNIEMLKHWLVIAENTASSTLNKHIAWAN